MHFLITAIVIVIVLVGVVSSCPSVCRCTYNSDGVIVYCSRRGLESIPTDLPHNTKELRLDNNAISVIDDNTFNKLTNLHYIDLDDNKITSIKSDTFNNLKNLYELHLQNNNISEIEYNAFNNLANLHYLELDMYCGCDSIPFWRWLKLNQKFSTSITCYDYGGEKLYNLQPNDFTDCFTCTDGKYGQDCSQDCSNNCYDNICHVVSGLCLSGCRKGWMGPYCKQLAPKSADNYTAVYTGVGTFVATALVAVIVFATMRYRKKKRQQQSQTVRELDSVTFASHSSNIGVHNTETHYVDTIPAVQEQPYDQTHNVDRSPVGQEQPYDTID